MRKLLFTALVCTLLCQVSNAQFKLPKVLVAAHLQYAAPTGELFSDAYRFGLGGDVEGGIGLGKTLLTGLADYKHYAARNASSAMKVTSLKIGLRQYLLAGLFLNVNAGNANVRTGSYSDNRFVVEGGAGFKLIGLEVLANYGSFSVPVGNSSVSYNSFILKAGFAFKL